MASTRGRKGARPASDVADLALAAQGSAQITWADGQMPVLRSIRRRFAEERPLEGIAVGACLHVTAETANLVRALVEGGADVALCAANPLSTRDEVAAALAEEHGAAVHAKRGEDADTYVAHVAAVAAHGAGAPMITLDDGADLLTFLHASGGADALLGGAEETTAGLLRARALEDDGQLRCPVIAVNEARAERVFNDHYGTGQSTVDGILRATNILFAGQTVVVLGYGWTGRGVCLRARGLGAQVVVCEIDPLRALEARMEGFEVMPALAAAERGDVFVTVTGSRDVLRREHFERMKDNAVLANAGHFDVEISIADLRELAGAPREVLPLVEQYDLGDRKLNLLASGRVVNLAAGRGHPSAVMDMSFALQALTVEHLVRRGGDLPRSVLPVPEAVDREVARLKLQSLGVAIDTPTHEQASYRDAWSSHDPPAAPPGS